MMILSLKRLLIIDTSISCEENCVLSFILLIEVFTRIANFKRVVSEDSQIVASFEISSAFHKENLVQCPLPP